MVAVIQLAITLGATAGGFLYDGVGYQATFMASAVFLLSAALLTMLVARTHTQQLNSKQREVRAMQRYEKFYIDGKWGTPLNPSYIDLINPETEIPFASIAMGGGDDVNKAVAAARKAFETFSQTSADERIALIDRIINAYELRIDEFAAAIAQEVGIPVSSRAQVMADQPHEGCPRLAEELCLRIEGWCKNRSSRAHWCVCIDIAVELADPDKSHQGDLCLGGRMYCCVKTERELADQCHFAC